MFDDLMSWGVGGGKRGGDAGEGVCGLVVEGLWLLEGREWASEGWLKQIVVHDTDNNLLLITFWSCRFCPGNSASLLGSSLGAVCSRWTFFGSFSCLPWLQLKKCLSLRMCGTGEFFRWSVGSYGSSLGTSLATKFMKILTTCCLTLTSHLPSSQTLFPECFLGHISSSLWFARDLTR